MKHLAHLAIAHPALVLRGQPEIAPDQITALRRARLFLRGEISLEDKPFALPDRARYPATFADCCSWYKEQASNLADGVVLDIESAGRHPVLFGFVPVNDLDAYLGIQIRLQGGAPAITPLYEAARVMGWVAAILADPAVPLITWNGDAFDLPELVHYASSPNGVSPDMIVYRRINWPGYPASLQETATSVLGWRNWKRLIRDEEKDADK